MDLKAPQTQSLHRNGPWETIFKHSKLYRALRILSLLLLILNIYIYTYTHTYIYMYVYALCLIIDKYLAF